MMLCREQPTVPTRELLGFTGFIFGMSALNSHQELEFLVPGRRRPVPDRRGVLALLVPHRQPAARGGVRLGQLVWTSGPITPRSGPTCKRLLTVHIAFV